MTSDREENRTLAERYYNNSVEELIELSTELVTEEFVLHDPILPEVVRGRDGYDEYYRTFTTSFSDLRLSADHILAMDEFVVVRFTLQGTHDEGEFMGVAPTGRSFSMTGIDINRIEDGRIAETWSEYDALGMLQQLGIVAEQPLD